MLFGDTKAVGNIFRSGVTDGLVQSRKLFHADLIGETGFLCFAKLRHQLQLGTGQNQVAHLEFRNGNAVENGIQIFFHNVIEVFRFPVQVVQRVVEFQGAHGDVLGVNHPLPIVNSHTDTARTHVGNRGIPLLQRGAFQALDNFFIDIGLFLAVFQHGDFQPVAHFQLIYHQRLVFCFPQSGAGDCLWLVNVI